MRHLLNYIHLFLLATSSMLLLCMAFAINPEIAHGAIIGRICWFHFTCFLFAIGTLFMEFTVSKSRFVFTLSDAILLLLFFVILYTYDKELNLQPEYLFFYVQLGVLWFMLRSAIQRYQELKLFFITLIIFNGIVVAAWGIGILKGDDPATHPVFKLLHDSIKPEPFVGYMAIILPICLNIALRFSNCNKFKWWETRTSTYYLAILGTILITIALLTNINHSTWAAACLSCLWVIWMKLIGWKKTKEIIKKHKRLFALSSIFLFILMTSAILLINIKKAEDGDRCLLIWNITTKAIMEHPVKGTGIGSFPTVYADAQARYFTSGLASEKEMINATHPTVAYNEYLTLGLELGIIGLLLFALWLAYSLYYGIKNRQFGASGGILALGIFALYSYPLHYPIFWMLLIFLSAICTTHPKPTYLDPRRNIPYIGMLAAIATCIIFFEQKHTFHTYKEWKDIHNCAQNLTGEETSMKYRNLYNRLCHQTDFLYEGAHVHSLTGNNEVAISWLKRAIQVNSDPKIYYAIARNKEILGQYQEAEQYLLHITNFLPMRGYTYFMLIQLYANPNWFQPDKLHETVRIFQSLQSIRQSEITPEMEEEVHHILEKITSEPEQISLVMSPSAKVSDWHLTVYGQNRD